MSGLRQNFDYGKEESFYPPETSRSTRAGPSASRRREQQTPLSSQDDQFPRIESETEGLQEALWGDYQLPSRISENVSDTEQTSKRHDAKLPWRGPEIKDTWGQDQKKNQVPRRVFEYIPATAQTSSEGLKVPQVKTSVKAIEEKTTVRDVEKIPLPMEVPQQVQQNWWSALKQQINRFFGTWAFKSSFVIGALGMLIKGACLALAGGSLVSIAAGCAVAGLGVAILERQVPRTSSVAPMAAPHATFMALVSGCLLALFVGTSWTGAAFVGTAHAAVTFVLKQLTEHQWLDHEPSGWWIVVLLAIFIVLAWACL